MIETTIRDPEKHETLTADSQGRVSLGVEYAAHDVEVVVVGAERAEAEDGALQQTIGEGPMTDDERKGMRFVRSFGIAERFLKDDHTAETDGEESVDPATVSPVDVDWSEGFLHGAENVALFAFEASADEEFPFVDTLTAEPASVTPGEIEGDAVYRYENGAGEASAIARTYADGIERVFGYDPATDLSHVRVAPDEAQMPVLFCDPDGDAYVAIAPRVPE